MFDDEAICKSCNWPISLKIGRWLTPDQSAEALPCCGGIEGAEHIPIPPTYPSGSAPVVDY